LARILGGLEKSAVHFSGGEWGEIRMPSFFFVNVHCLQTLKFEIFEKMAIGFAFRCFFPDKKLGGRKKIQDPLSSGSQGTF